MTLSKKAFVGFTVIFLGAIAISIFAVISRTNLNYINIKVDRPLLNRLNTNYKRFILTSQLQTVFGRDRVRLTPYIEVLSGSAGDYAALLSDHTGSIAFPSNKPLSSYEVSKVQLNLLLAIPGVAYFVLSPMLYAADNNYIAYKITPYNSSNAPIAITGEYLVLKPCPPARAYE